MQKILVLGANSAIAQAVCRLWVQEGHSLYLVGRNPEKLEALSQDLKVRGAHSLFSESLDLTNTDLHQGLLERSSRALGGLDRVFVAYGELGDQKKAEADTRETFRILHSNFLSQVSLLTYVAQSFEAVRKGQIIVISSVAGNRGRMSNYVYGAAKGALSIFLSGLRNRLFHSGVNVIDLKLGFVDTPMTAGFPKGPLWAQPEAVAKAIVKASSKRRDIVYIPFFWASIMAIVGSIPEAIFKRLRL